jgi:hypothetical protein
MTLQKEVEKKVKLVAVSPQDTAFSRIPLCQNPKIK